MSRREFSKTVRRAVIKRATDARGNVRCERKICGGIAHPFQIDHVNPDGLTGEPTLANAELLCIPCHRDKTAQDVKIIAKQKRREVDHLGAKPPPAKPIKSAPFPPSKRRDKHPMPALPPRPLFRRVGA